MSYWGWGLRLGSGGSGAASPDALLLEIGDYILLENGDRILLEDV